MGDSHDEHYERICKPRFDKVEENAKENNEKTHEIHRIVTNGLVQRVNDNYERIKSLDNRLWALLTGVSLSIGLQIVFYLLRNA